MFLIPQNLTEADRKRIEDKALLTLQPLRHQLSDHLRNLSETEKSHWTLGDWIGSIEAWQRLNIRWPRGNKCLECDNQDCAAWAALRCGGCNQTFWIEQSLITNLWCNGCAFQHYNTTWESELQAKTGLRTQLAVQLFKTVEQKILAYLRWELEQVVYRITAQNQSSILAVRCRKRIPISQHSIVGPLRGDPEEELDLLLQRLKGLRVRKLGQVRLKGTRKDKYKSGKKANRYNGISHNICYYYSA